MLCSFSTFVAAVIRTLVGFYDISYSDGLAVCGAVAREMLSYGAPRAGASPHECCMSVAHAPERACSH